VGKGKGKGVQTPISFEKCRSVSSGKEEGKGTNLQNFKSQKRGGGEEGRNGGSFPSFLLSGHKESEGLA